MEVLKKPFKQPVFKFDKTEFALHLSNLNPLLFKYPQKSKNHFFSVFLSVLSASVVKNFTVLKL